MNESWTMTIVLPNVTDKEFCQTLKLTCFVAIAHFGLAKILVFAPILSIACIASLSHLDKQAKSISAQFGESCICLLIMFGIFLHLLWKLYRAYVQCQLRALLGIHSLGRILLTLYSLRHHLSQFALESFQDACMLLRTRPQLNMVVWLVKRTAWIWVARAKHAIETPRAPKYWIPL